MSEKKINFSSHPNYEIKEELGKGGFGSVYKVINKNDNKIYAIKRVSIKGLKQKDLDFIKNEANILSSIENENIVKYYESFYENDFFNIVMEYCEFGDLRKIINEFKAKGQFFSKSGIYYFLKNIFLGLKEIHEKHLIHRDLKPENLFLKNDLRLMIGDFGVAKQLQDGTVHANSLIGTLNYMAPEILRREKYSNKVDIYALGCIIYELCTLNFYSGNKTGGKINVNFYGEDLQNLIDKLVENEPNKRPSIDEIEKIVNDFIYQNDETCLVKSFRKNEILKTLLLEISITKYLEQMQDRAFNDEKRNKLFISAGISGIGLILSVSGLFLECPIGVGLVLASFAFLGINKLIEKFSNKDEFIAENELIFELIERKIQKRIVDDFKNKIPKEKIIIYNDENFENIIKEIKNILLRKNYMESLKQLMRNNFNVLLVGCTGVGKSTLINEFLKLDKEKAKESEGIPTKTEDFIPYKGKNNNINYTLHDTNGITYKGEDSIDKKIENTLNQIKTRIEKKNPNNLIHCIWYCYNGTNIQPGDIDFIVKLLNIYSTYNIPLIFVHTRTINKNDSKLCKKGLEDSLKKKNVEKEKIEDILKNYIDVLARDCIINNDDDNVEEEEEKEDKKAIIIKARGLKNLEKITRQEIEKKGMKSAYFECIKQDIMPILINGAFDIVFTSENLKQLYKNASEDLNKFVDNLIAIIEDKELNLTEDIKNNNRKSIEIIHDSFKKVKNIIRIDLEHLLSMDKLKMENEECLKIAYDLKSEEYKNKMSFEEYCIKVENIIYKNISKNAKENINNMMNILFNMYVMKIIKEGVKEKFSFIEKQVIDEIYRELFKEM